MLDCQSNECLKGDNMAWSFKQAVNTFYPKAKIYKDNLKSLYNKGRSKTNTTGKAVYALYLNRELKKIGKAVCGKGLFTRMSQYYRLAKAGCKKITKSNRDNIEVEYFFLDDKTDCWIAERKLQVDAWDNGEKMPWEDKTRN